MTAMLGVRLFLGSTVPMLKNASVNEFTFSEHSTLINPNNYTTRTIKISVVKLWFMNVISTIQQSYFVAKPFTSGVPLRTILAPIIFIIYVNT